MSRWADVVATALVGAARGGVNPEALLDEVAAHALRRRAGVALVDDALPPEPAPADSTPMVGPEAAARGGDLLALGGAPVARALVRDMAGRIELLGEWLEAVAAAGRRVPPELVPALLDAGRRHPELRALIPPVAGQVAAWLAAQRAEWAYASGSAPVESTSDDWDLGSARARVEYLAALRERDPRAGRELLAAAWDAEPPDTRAPLLAALDVGLSPDDEPLLERALDGRAAVRTVALDLLTRLPARAHATRMAVRARACLDLSGTGPIEVHPPAECDRAMRRDGVTPRPPAGIGERAWWLEEVLARTPLREWPEPGVFPARGVVSQWAATVRRGLARAAAAQQDAAWASALVDPITADAATRPRADDGRLLDALYDALPGDELTERAIAAVSHSLSDAGPVEAHEVLARCPTPWPPALSTAVLAALEDRLGQRDTRWRAAGLCDVAALRLPPDLATRATALAERVPGTPGTDPTATAVERFAATLRFRHQMHEELS